MQSFHGIGLCMVDSWLCPM